MRQSDDRVVETRIPARMDRLPWSRWHWLVVAALGTVWILDGLEVTIVGGMGSVLQKPETLVFAIGNFLGPLALGHLFDTVGRHLMIAGTYALSALLLALTAWLFAIDVLSATTQTIAWAVIFFIASASASSAYLTVSEVFPLETRALAIAVFYSLGTGVGGIGAPVLFGALIGTQGQMPLTWGYLAGALLLLIAALIEVRMGVRAEQESLEDVAAPLAAEDGEPGDGGVRDEATRSTGGLAGSPSAEA
jgi:MFS family permease